MVRQAAGQDIREYVGGRIFGSRIDMHCRSYPGIGHLVCVQEASGTVHAFAQEYPALYSGGGYHLWSGFAERIADALARTDYREAVRLLYLQTLKQLSDGKRMDWQLYKTPTQYIYEVRLPAFRQMTNHFLRVRYGNFEATETLFHAMRDLQKEVEKGGAA